MAITAVVDDKAVRIGLGELRAGISDRASMLKIVGDLMRSSIATTFREEGSPAGSWPALALSTLKNKKYKGAHKLLVLSGLLFGSINYEEIAGETLTIGTDRKYARVQQEGSADRRGGSIGAQAKIAGRGVSVGSYAALRVRAFRQYGVDKRRGKDGKMHTVHVRAQGPDNATRYNVREHTRHQNIRARPFLVFRPEDPARFVSGIEAFLGAKTVRIGKAGAA
jgi:phage gpG-like protein